jgi:hypothetical protein
LDLLEGYIFQFAKFLLSQASLQSGNTQSFSDMSINRVDTASIHICPRRKHDHHGKFAVVIGEFKNLTIGKVAQTFRLSP